MKRGRGRPRKTRPATLTECTSDRDIAKVLKVSRGELARWKALASIPEDEFDRLLESDDPPTARQLELLARRRAGKRTTYERKCPHCGGLLRIEGMIVGDGADD